MITTWKYKNRFFTYLQEHQFPEIVQLLHDPECEKYLWFAPITLERFSNYALPILEEQKKSLDRSQYPVSSIFAVTEEGRLLGVCGISEMHDAHYVASIGYQLKRSAWGKGVGTSCLEFLVHYTKKYLNIRKLFGDCVAANLASIRVMEKCGFSFEGTLKEKYELAGVIHDNSWFGLTMADAPDLPDDSVQKIQ